MKRALFRVMDRIYEFGLEPGSRRHWLLVGALWSATLAPIATCLIGSVGLRSLATAVASIYTGATATACFALIGAWDEHDSEQERP